MSDSAVLPLFLFAAARAWRASEPRFGTARRGGGLATSIAVGIPVTPKPCRSSLFRRGIGDRIAAESEGGGACGSLGDASSTNPAAFARGDDVAGVGAAGVAAQKKSLSASERDEEVRAAWRV